MIVLLNILPFAVLFTSIWLMYKKKRPIFGVIGFLFCILYAMFQPSYMPKGVVARTPVVEFKQKELEVEDRLLRPKSEEEYDAEREEKYKTGLQFAPR